MNKLIRKSYMDNEINRIKKSINQKEMDFRCSNDNSIIICYVNLMCYDYIDEIINELKGYAGFTYEDHVMTHNLGLIHVIKAFK